MRRSTQAALLSFRDDQPDNRKTYVKMVVDLGLRSVDTGLLSDVINWNEGHVSTARENRLREALGLKTGRTPRATIQIKPETRERLRSLRRAGESFDDVIVRMLQHFNEWG